MFRRQMPFQFTLLSSSDPHTFKDGQIISTFNKCGLFFCRKGNVEVSLEDKHFQINPGDVYIYMWLLPWCICFIRVRMRKGLWLKWI